MRSPDRKRHVSVATEFVTLRLPDVGEGEIRDEDGNGDEDEGGVLPPLSLVVVLVEGGIDVDSELTVEVTDGVASSIGVVIVVAGGISTGDVDGSSVTSGVQVSSTGGTVSPSVGLGGASVVIGGSAGGVVGMFTSVTVVGAGLPEK